MKACRRCGSTENGFTKSSSSKDGLNSLCKPCSRAQSNETYARRVGRPVRSQRTQIGYERHGYSELPEYYLWSGIKDRCLNPNSPAFQYYGSRGITICREWAESFACFLKDVGHRPFPDYTIERIDNSKGYEPSNVKWATRKEQMRNTRATRLITLDGITLCASDWAKLNGVPRGTVLGRLSKGYNEIDAVTPLPVRGFCERCGNEFRPGYKSQRFCGVPCRTRAANARFRAAHKTKEQSVEL